MDTRSITRATDLTVDNNFAVDATTVLDQLPLIAYQADPTGVWRFLNASWKRVTGFEIRECIGRLQEEFLHPKDITRFHELLASLSDNPDTDCAGTFRFLTKSSDFVWLECHARLTQGGLPNGYKVFGSLSNITDRVDEEALLLAHHRTLSGMLNDLPGMAYRCRNNPDWTMEYVSAGSLELTGYPPEDIVNNNKLSYGSLIHPDDREFVWNEVQSALRENRRFEKNYRIITADGTVKWIWENGKGIYSPGKELLGIEGFIAEIKTWWRQSLAEHAQDVFYDPVTQTPTIALFKDRIAQARLETIETRDKSIVLLCINLDHFQPATAKYPQAELADAYKDIFSRIRSVFAEGDSICRLTSNQIAVLTKQRSDAIEVLCGQLQDLFLAPIEIKDNSIFVTLSIGAVVDFQRAEATYDQLEEALLAMNSASELGGGHYKIINC